MIKQDTSCGLQRVCSLMGVPFEVAEDIAAVLAERALGNTLSTVVTPNPEILMVTLRLPGYRETLAQATLSLPDGNGLFWATSFLKETQEKGTAGVLMKFITTYARLVIHRQSLRHVLPRLHHGSDTFFQLHALWSTTFSPRIFYFGGEGKVLEQIVPVMQNRYPNLHIVGNCGGYPFASEQEFEQILQTIEAAKPQVIFVALNFPKQEQWIMQTKERLEAAGVRLVMGFGGTFDFAVGKKKRAPRWMHRLGIEWLWRLMLEPARIGRIWTAVVGFPLTILRRRLQGKNDLQIY